MKGLKFIFIFVGLFIALMFTPAINELAGDAVTAAGEGMAGTLYAYVPVFYAITIIIFLVGSLVTIVRR